jgi:ribosome biogenesis protein Nip4
MRQATSGQEFNKSTYAYKLPVMSQAEIESFYDQQLKAAGWSSEFTASTGEHGGILVFNKDSQVLTITVTAQNQELLVLLILE